MNMSHAEIYVYEALFFGNRPFIKGGFWDQQWGGTSGRPALSRPSVPDGQVP